MTNVLLYKFADEFEPAPVVKFSEPEPAPVEEEKDESKEEGTI